MKIFDPNVRMSEQKMVDLLRKADLEGHGYKVENTTKLVTEPGSYKPIYRKSMLFYKVVDCSRLQEIDQELQTLLPGKNSNVLNPIEITGVFECFENYSVNTKV